MTRLIDLEHLGRRRVIGCWQVGDVLIDPGPSSCLPTLLAALGEARPRALLLTHVHLDHAGASGSLARRWPELEVYVHERGARHLVAPDRLVQSARRLYGDDMDRLWGEVVPIPEHRLRVLHGGEQLLQRQLRGRLHAGARVAPRLYLHEGTAYVGDTGGVRITPTRLTIPPTPPPDIDVEAWHESLARLAAWAPQRLAMTHFGASEDVEAQLAEVGERLDAWAQRVRGIDLEQFVASVRVEVEQSAGRRAGRHVRAGGAAGPAVRRARALLAQTRSSARQRASILSAACPRRLSCPGWAGQGAGSAASGVSWSSTTTSTRSITWPRRSRA